MNNMDTMRISHLYKIVLVALFAIGTSLSVYAQFVPTYQVIAGESLVFPNVTSFGGTATAFADNGSIIKNPLGGTQYQFTYISDPGFLGVDTVQFNFFVSPGNITHSIAYVDVVPSIINANNDFATTNLDQAIEVNVLNNDFSSMGILELTSIPVVSNGFAFILPDSSIYYQPDPGFAGFGSLNYVVCDSIDNCSTGTLTISVTDGSEPTVSDSIYVSTLQDNPLTIPLTYEGYEISSSPSNGSAVIEPGGVITYTPDAGFVGLDVVVVKRTFSGQILFRDIFIDVLPQQNTNTVAFDDYGYTPINTDLEINVTNNDIGNFNIHSFTQPQFGEGVVTKINGDILKFAPSTDYTGAAEFTYTVKNNGGFIETATVTVEVDDQEPQDEPFELYTNKNTPLILYYDIPIEYAEFSIVNDPNHGNLIYYDQDTTITVQNQSINVSNVMVYYPDIDYTGDDEFEINYCITVNNTCYLTKIIVHVLDVGTELCASQDCVWPGDANNDGIANMLDLLQLGRTIGEFGIARVAPSIDWFGQFANEWGKSSFGSNLDIKYADTDGNGEVNQDDLTGLDNSYNFTHTVHPEINPFEKTYPIILQATSAGPYNAGDLVTFDLLLGQSGNEAINMYGFTYAFEYNSTFVDPSSIDIDFDENSWLYTNNNSPVLSLTKNLELLERVDVGVTRTNGYSVSGHGKVATVSFIIDDDIDPQLASRFVPIDISIKDIIGQDDNGQYFRLPDFETQVIYDTGGADDLATNEDLILFPNPTDQFLTIHLNGEELMTDVTIYSITGVEMFSINNVQWERAELDVSKYAQGMYIVKSKVSDGSVLQKKFQVIKE